MGKQFRYDETAFKPKQREVALALVEREFSTAAEAKTKDEIAQEFGTTAMTIWRWEKQDPNFIAYMNHLSTQFIDSGQARVYAKLMEAVNKGNVKAMELFMKRMGDLDNKSEISISQTQDDNSLQERIDKIQERRKAALAAAAVNANGTTPDDEDGVDDASDGSERE